MRSIPQFKLRLALTASVLVFGILALQALSRPEQVPMRNSFSEFPFVLGVWNGRDEALEDRVVKALGVDDYLNRVYSRAAGDPVQLYIGYYKSQKAGETIHSPKNCLPGGGWMPVRSTRLAFDPGDGSSVQVNEYIIEKGREEDLVLYWYQSQGRVIASEYTDKLCMVVDSLRRHRTDGALVRIWTPVRGDEASARSRAVSMAHELFPLLNDFISN